MQDFTTLPTVKKRFVVIVNEMEEGRPVFCEISDCTKFPPHHICIVCNRRCCEGCIAYSPLFGNSKVCDECWELPLEDQQRIAQLTKDLNQ